MRNNWRACERLTIHKVIDERRLFNPWALWRDEGESSDFTSICHRLFIYPANSWRREINTIVAIVKCENIVPAEGIDEDARPENGPDQYELHGLGASSVFEFTFCKPTLHKFSRLERWNKSHAIQSMLSRKWSLYDYGATSDVPLNFGPAQTPFRRLLSAELRTVAQ